jgi:hypothetical protein
MSEKPTRKRRVLSPETKWEIFLQVTTRATVWATLLDEAAERVTTTTSLSALSVLPAGPQRLGVSGQTSSAVHLMGPVAVRRSARRASWPWCADASQSGLSWARRPLEMRG